VISFQFTVVSKKEESRRVFRRWGSANDIIPWELGAEADRPRLDFEREEKEEYNAETLGPPRYRREARGEANPAS
jgi:hypothetical protein